MQQLCQTNETSIVQSLPPDQYSQPQYDANFELGSKLQSQIKICKFATLITTLYLVHLLFLPLYYNTEYVAMDL